jgi:serine protease
MAPLEEAIAYAFENGVVVVAAAGNETFPMCGNPANQEHVICVGATGPDDAIVSYSNFDATQASSYVVAPGGEPAGLTCESFILSTWPTSLTPTACAPPEQTGYDVNTGTSMAAPFVAGVAALLVARGLNNKKVARCLTRTAKDLGQEGRDAVYGYGRVRAARAVRSC